MPQLRILTEPASSVWVAHVKRYCEMLNRARIDGYFYTVYNDDFDKGYGLYNGTKRKKGFYMYKSYQRVT